MARAAIICVDDQREILALLRKDLEMLHASFEVIECESADEAWEILEECDASGTDVPVIICDCVMPGKSGVMFLSEVHRDGRFSHLKKVLLTGQASHEDTIDAINLAHIDSYISKPWQPEQLLADLRRQITRYVFDAGLDYRDFPDCIDQGVLLERMKQ